MKWIGSLLAFVLATSVQAQTLPEFELDALDGQSYHLPAEQEGIGIYLFWASWCPYCRALMPHLQSIVDQYGSDVSVYALQFRDEESPESYIERNGFDFVVFPDADETASAWGMRGTPGVVILDKNRQVRFNLYEVLVENPAGYEEMSHPQRAARRAPFWAARIRETLTELRAETP